MNRRVFILLCVALSMICSARYLPKSKHIKQTSNEWTETAKKLGWNDEQTAAVVNLMQFIQDHDIASAEMDTNTDWKDSMLDKCEKLANFDKIDEQNDHVGDKKWHDVKDSDFTAKWEFWNDKYTKWDCEQGKMIALKNMCIVVTEDVKKKAYMETAQKSGLKESQWLPTADLVWKILSASSAGEKKSILADHCEMLNDDNVIFDSNEEHSLNGMEWSDFKVGKDISTYMEFWWNITEQAESNVSKIKALKNLCVEFMCPIERKEIEGWVKEAGINEDEILAAVDLEMRMRMAKTNCQQSKMIILNYQKLGKNKYMMEPAMTKKELAQANELENQYWVNRVHFWAEKYRNTTGADHIKALKNMCVIVMQEEENKAMKKTE